MEKITEININGHICRYQHIDNPNKPIMIFLMGALQDIEHTYAFSSRFRKHFNFYVIELPGMGKTMPLPNTYSLSYIAECLNEFVNQIVKDKFNLVAISYATGIALEYAKIKNNLLKKMAIIGGMSKIPELNYEALLDLMLKSKRDPEIFIDDFIDFLTTKSHYIPNHKNICRLAKKKAKSNIKDGIYKHFTYNTLRLLNSNIENLTSIECPTLVYTGEFDPFVTPQQSKRLAESLPNGKFEILKGCDHLFALENPNEAIHLVNSFLIDGYQERNVA